MPVLCVTGYRPPHKSSCQLGRWLSKPVMAAMLLLQQQGWALQPIEWKRSRVAPLLWRHKIHNGTAAQCRGTSFPLFFHPSFLASPGARGETAFPEDRRAKRVGEFGHVARPNSGRGSIYTTFICLVVLICSLTSRNNSFKTPAIPRLLF